MLKYIYQTLILFKKAFSRKTTWIIFCVAYFPAAIPQKRQVGRPRQYGEKVKLVDLFDLRELFKRVECTIYGKVEFVSIAALDLLWKPTGGLIRFVLAITKRGPIILKRETRNPIAPPHFLVFFDRN